MLTKVLVFALVAVVCSAERRSYQPPSRPSYQPPSRPSYQPPSRPSYQASDEDVFEAPKYEFDWNVSEDYAKFSHNEDRNDDSTSGSYSVDLPDGRRQTVTYHVSGDSGFVAEVSYSGEARYPESREYSAPQPAYQPPRTTPRPAYQPPRATPRPAYQPPRTTSRPAYQPPRTTPRPTYSAPRPTTRPAYSAPRPSRPSNSFDARSLLKAYGF